MTWQEVKTDIEALTTFNRMGKVVYDPNTKNNQLYQTIQLPLFLVDKGVAYGGDVELYQMKDDTGTLIDEYYFISGSTPIDIEAKLTK